MEEGDCSNGENPLSDHLGCLFDACDESRKGRVRVSTLFSRINDHYLRQDASSISSEDNKFNEVRRMMDPFKEDPEVDRLTWLSAWKSLLEPDVALNDSDESASGSGLVFKKEESDDSPHDVDQSFNYSPSSHVPSPGYDEKEFDYLRSQCNQLLKDKEDLKELLRNAEDALLQEQESRKKISRDLEAAFKKNESLMQAIEIVEESQKELESSLAVSEHEKIELCNAAHSKDVLIKVLQSDVEACQLECDVLKGNLHSANSKIETINHENEELSQRLKEYESALSLQDEEVQTLLTKIKMMNVCLEEMQGHQSEVNFNNASFDEDESDQEHHFNIAVGFSSSNKVDQSPHQDPSSVVSQQVVTSRQQTSKITHQSLKEMPGRRSICEEIMLAVSLDNNNSVNERVCKYDSAKPLGFHTNQISEYMQNYSSQDFPLAAVEEQSSDKVMDKISETAFLTNTESHFYSVSPRDHELSLFQSAFHSTNPDNREDYLDIDAPILPNHFLCQRNFKDGTLVFDSGSNLDTQTPDCGIRDHTRSCLRQRPILQTLCSSNSSIQEPVLVNGSSDCDFRDKTQQVSVWKKVVQCVLLIFTLLALVIFSTILCTAGVLEVATETGVITFPLHGRSPNWLRFILKHVVEIRSEAFEAPL